MLCGMSFCKEIPKTILLIGNSGNCIINYILQRIAKNSIKYKPVVEVIDSCSASQYINSEIIKIYNNNNKNKNVDTEVNIIRDNEIPEKIVDDTNNPIQIYIYPYTISFEKLINSIKCIGTLPGEVIYNRCYEIIFQDIDAQPKFRTLEHLQKIYNILSPEYGVFITRMYRFTTPLKNFTMLEKDFGSPDEYIDTCINVFNHVYVSVPEILQYKDYTTADDDTFIIIVCIRTNKKGDDTTALLPSLKNHLNMSITHPLNERLIDNSVYLYDRGLITLDVLERSDSFVYMGSNARFSS